MKKIVFVGGMDKLDMIIYSASIMHGATNEEKNCLVVDMTESQKSKYIIPSIDRKEERPERYITTYQGVDIAIGYDNFELLKQDGILENFEQGAKSYEYIYIDIDLEERLASIPFGEEDMIFLTTTMDIYSLERAIEALRNFNISIPVHRILFGRKMNSTHLNYLAYLSQGLKLRYSEYIITFPYDNGDLTVVHENQKARRLNLKPLSKEFKNGLHQVNELIEPAMDKNIYRYIKILEKVKG